MTRSAQQSNSKCEQEHDQVRIRDLVNSVSGAAGVLYFLFIIYIASLLRFILFELALKHLYIVIIYDYKRRSIS